MSEYHVLNWTLWRLYLLLCLQLLWYLKYIILILHFLYYIHYTQKVVIACWDGYILYYILQYTRQSGKVSSMFLVKIVTFCCFMGPWINFFLTVMPLHPWPSCLSTLMLMLNVKAHCSYRSVLITLPLQNTNIIVDGVCALIILTHYKFYCIKQIAQYSSCMAWTKDRILIKTFFADCSRFV